MTEKATGFVIRQADFSESSRVVTFYTREHGKIAMLAKGGRRAKNAFDDALDLLSESSLEFIQKQNALSLLTEASLKNRFRPPSSDLSALYAGYYLAELLTGLTEESDPDAELYDHASATIRALSKAERQLRTVSRFELQLLTAMGQCPIFDACLVCGDSVEASSAKFVHWVSEGGLICSACRVESFRSTEICARTIELMRRLANPSDAMEDLASISKREARELRSVLDQLVSHALERRPKMSRYLKF